MDCTDIRNYFHNHMFKIDFPIANLDYPLIINFSRSKIFHAIYLFFHCTFSDDQWNPCLECISYILGTRLFWINIIFHAYSKSFWEHLAHNKSKKRVYIHKYWYVQRDSNNFWSNANISLRETITHDLPQNFYHTCLNIWGILWHFFYSRQDEWLF